MKRIIDIVGAIVGLMITAVVMLFIAPAVKLESPGPLIFKQKRVGKMAVISIFIRCALCIRMQRRARPSLWKRMK